MPHTDRDEHLLYYGPNTPRRPVRDLESALANPDVRLMNAADLAANNARAGTPGALVIPCTPIVEVSPDGARLEARPYAGFAFVEEDRRRHALWVGATGSGKTYRVALPLLMSTLAGTRDSVVFTNMKGPTGTEEIRALVKQIDPTAEVIVFAPSSPHRSVACNLLAVARRNGLLPLLVRAVCSTVPRGVGDSGFWEAVSSKGISAAVRYPEIQSLAGLHELLAKPELLSTFARRTNDPDLIEFDAFGASGSNGSTSRIDALSRLAPFSEIEAIRAVTSGRDEFDPGPILRTGKRFVLIVESNETQFEDARHAIACVLALFLAVATQAAENAGGVLTRPITSFIDEFGVMPRLQNFAQTANLARSRGMSLHVFAQSIEQIFATYGSDAGAIMSALCSKTFMCGGLSLADREYASRLAASIVASEWRETQMMDAQSEEWVPATRSSHFVIRPLITPDDLIQTPHPVFGGYAVTFLVDQRPAIVHFTPAWDIPVIARAMQEARCVPPVDRDTPLPPVPLTGHFADFLSGAPQNAAPIAPNDSLTNTTGWTDSEIRARLETVLQDLGWSDTKGAARLWWEAFMHENTACPAQLLHFAEELERRRSTIQECFDAYNSAQTNSMQAVLHFIDYEIAKRRADNAT